MRKVILFMHVSLDGFICGPNGELDWATMDDDEMGKYLISDLLTTVDSMLLGRVLYKGFESHWPQVAKDHTVPKELAEFARWIDNSPKYVFSKTLEKVEWQNSILLKGELSEEIDYLKKQQGGDMVLFGGAGIVSSFTRLDLIDEYRLKVEPIVLGNGKSLFEGYGKRNNPFFPAGRLKLTNSKAFNSGVVGLYYTLER
jgi:dihydrofolate reductase